MGLSVCIPLLSWGVSAYVLEKFSDESWGDGLVNTVAEFNF